MYCRVRLLPTRGPAASLLEAEAALVASERVRPDCAFFPVSPESPKRPFSPLLLAAAAWREQRRVPVDETDRFFPLGVCLGSTLTRQLRALWPLLLVSLFRPETETLSLLTSWSACRQQCAAHPLSYALPLLQRLPRPSQKSLGNWSSVLAQPGARARGRSPVEKDEVNHSQREEARREEARREEASRSARGKGDSRSAGGGDQREEEFVDLMLGEDGDAGARREDEREEPHLPSLRDTVWKRCREAAALLHQHKCPAGSSRCKRSLLQHTLRMQSLDSRIVVRFSPTFMAVSVDTAA
ncbi:hypothetical protein TGARI_368990 [Toxoplasma gondii ARI]|uniref:Uncharacterized protein n=1 Tax=Toxoplasma gondii ARI TaxID=1074872 RepID=A0A139Y477_TOXGO|nr:hypothetical protein TGARI_368990 [Toxoplasma gondii ARI]